jgi:hypothetical protein
MRGGQEGVLAQDIFEPARLDWQRLRSKSEENDPVVRKALAEDQLAEIAVVRDEDPLLGLGNGKNGMVA